MTRFENKYRIESARLKGYDYSAPGEYFVTICTKGMVEWFGRVESGEMILNEIGEIVADEWVRTPTIRPNVELDNWVVMPNHVHGIVILKSLVETQCTASLQRPTTPSQPQKQNHNTFGPQRMNLASIVRGFKAATTKQIRELGKTDFAWEPRYYDHIVRNDEDLNRIQDYIRNNPVKWDREKNHPGDMRAFIE